MKKIIASFLAAVLLLSAFAVNIFAADDTVVLSLKGAEGKPGDIIEVQVFLDENPGLWCCGFDIAYNASYFQLGDVENGSVFSDAAFTKAPITPTGSYRFLALVPGTSFENVYGTGLLCTLRFKILETAPNGNHSVSIKLAPGNNIVRADSSDKVTPFVPEIGEPATIKVVDSQATAPVTDADTTDANGTDKSEDTTGRPVTEYVTDADNYVVRNEDNVPVTQVVTEVVTDEEGNPKFDENGAPITEIVTELVTETAKQDSDDEEDGQKNVGMKKIILIVGIVLLVVAAAVIVVILFNARKKGDASKDEKADQTNTDDSDKQE